MKIVVILRPPGDDDRVTRLESVLDELLGAGHDVELWTAWAAADATRYASEAAESGADLVLVAGGDGTVNEVVNWIAVAERHPRVGIVPFGTANDFARGLGIPTR